MIHLSRRKQLGEPREYYKYEHGKLVASSPRLVCVTLPPDQTDIPQSYDSLWFLHANESIRFVTVLAIACDVLPSVLRSLRLAHPLFFVIRFGVRRIFLLCVSMQWLST